MAARNGGRTNGASHPSMSFAAAGVPYDDPMSKVLGLDSKTSGAAAWFGFTSGSTAVMVALGLLASYLAWVQAHRPRPAAVTPDEIDIVRDDPPPPPPEPPKEEEEKPAPAAHVVAPRDAPPPPPAPAQAAKVITAEPDPQQPVDMRDTIIEGNADSFAGGLSASNGTNTTAVRTLPAPSGVPGGTGPVTAAPAVQLQGPDRSRKASLGGGAEWSCPFPPESDTAQIDDAYVTIQVDVRADGSPTAVRVVTDPGNGFGREARRCAMNRRYSTALDHDGNPIAGTANLRVHFSR